MRRYRKNPRTVHTVEATTLEMVVGGLLVASVGVFLGYKWGASSTSTAALATTTPGG
jgi:hypothetical protein